MNAVKGANRPTEKILVSVETKRELIQIKQPGERYGDVVARLLEERKKNDYLSYLKSLAENGDFVSLDTDVEYNQIRKKAAGTEIQD